MDGVLIPAPAGPGTFHLLPLGQRVHSKLCLLLDSELERAGCQRLSLPHLTPASLWRRSGRLEGMGRELVRLRDRHDRWAVWCWPGMMPLVLREVVLSPTHEESVTSLLAGMPVITEASLPLRLYQIGAKFRSVEQGWQLALNILV